MSTPYSPVPSSTSQPPAPIPSWNGDAYHPRPLPPRQKSRGWLHVVLFVLTALSTWYVGGVSYSISLMAILTAHEFGHYFAARFYRVKATLPFFMPFPITPLGTLGAVIRMSPYIPNRRALFDIAAAGPIAGLVVALPISYIGIALSKTVPSSVHVDGTLTLGLPFLFQAMQWIQFGSQLDNADLVLHGMAFAGWVGLFVTALNLLPISQLDGGHVIYAVFGKRSRMIAGAAFLALGVITLIKGYHYFLMLALLLYMGIGHPPTLNDGVELGPARRIVAAILLLIFILCFTPAPFQM